MTRAIREQDLISDSYADGYEMARFELRPVLKEKDDMLAENKGQLAEKDDVIAEKEQIMAGVKAALLKDALKAVLVQFKES